MDREKYLILINGQDKTDSVKEFQPCGDACDVVYTSSPKVYHYQGGKVKILELRQRIDPAGLIVTVKGVRMAQVDEILDFGSFYRVIRTGNKVLSCHREDVEIQRNCLAGDKQKSVFNYFKETAEAVSLVVGDNLNILSKQYERIQAVSEKTVLACYLEPGRSPETFYLPETVIYPFGLNQSQKVAVENALSSQISIIQGPPGTGKTNNPEYYRQRGKERENSGSSVQ